MILRKRDTETVIQTLGIETSRLTLVLSEKSLKQRLDRDSVKNRDINRDTERGNETDKEEYETESETET